MDMERGLEGEMPSAKLREIERGIVYERVVEVERSTEMRGGRERRILRGREMIRMMLKELKRERDQRGDVVKCWVWQLHK